MGAQAFAELLLVAHRVFVEEVGHRDLVDRFAVDRQFLVEIRHLVAGNTDHALDVVERRLRRITENHDVATCGRRTVRDLGVDDRQTQAVGELVHQDQVARQQCRHHRARWNLERLEQERAQQKDRDDHGKQPSRPVEPPRLHHQAFTRFIVDAVDLGDALAREFPAAFGKRRVERSDRTTALRQEIETLGQPVGAGDHGGDEQQQRKVAFDGAEIPGADIAHESREDQGSEECHVGRDQSSTCRIARKASCGTSTEPICFIRFLPAFCFSSSFFLREMSPP